MTYINHLYTWSAGNLEDMLMKQILMKRIYIWMTEPFLNQEWVCNEYIPFNDHYKQHWHNLMVTGKQLIIDSSIFGFANDFNILDEFCKLQFTDNWRWIPLYPYYQDFANDRNKLILPANVCIAPIFVEGDYCFSLQDEEWFAISTLQNKLCTTFCINSQLNEMGAMHTLAGKINLFLSFAKSWQ
jgi:hypothetical protein